MAFDRSTFRAVPYSGWFGDGNTKADLDDAIAQHGGDVVNVWYCEAMVLIEFEDAFIVTGYDGDEYCHTFTFPK